MKQATLALIFCLAASASGAQWIRKPVFSGIYLQWGYNRNIFSPSDLHFSNGDKYNFTVHKAKAHDQPDFEGFWEAPLDITIPQNSYRIGIYLNPEHTHAIEINFDHAKYVMEKNQRARVTGTINGEPVDADTVINPWFLSFEHTNGANFYHINYVGQDWLWHGKKHMKASAVWKIGAGIVVPRSDVTIMGRKLDNKFHVAGYIASAEAGLRFYPLKDFFLEATGKGGFANYLDVLTVEQGKARHHFWYGEIIGLIGYDLNFRKKRK